MYAMPVESITVRNNRAILCYRPADRGYNRYVTLDAAIKPFHRHFALYLVDGKPQAFGVTTVENIDRDLPAPAGDYQLIAKLWEQKYHRQVVFCKAWSLDNPSQGDVRRAITTAISEHTCESSV